MELLLCSAGLGCLGAWLDTAEGDARSVAFVDTAARPLPSAPFVESCRESLEDAGCDVVDLDLTTASAGEVERALHLASTVFVTGGHPVYLLQHARQSGFLRAVRTQVAAGQLRYAGVSAGAALAGPSIEPLAGPDDPGRVDDYSALSLVDFVVLSHANRRTEQEVAKRVAHWADQFELRPLRDDEALAVRDGEIERLDSPT